MRQLVVPISRAFAPYLEPALARLGYLNPTATFSYDADSVSVLSTTDFDEERMRRDVLYEFYREKIYAETLPLRRNLLAVVSSP